MKSACRMAARSCSTTTHGVARVAQPAEQREQPVGVARVQADRRLVEHVQRVHQPRAERVGERDALRLAAGQRAGLAVEREIAEPDVAEEAEPGVELLEDELRRPRARTAVSASAASQCVDPVHRPARPPTAMVSLADPDRQRVGVEPAAAARSQVLAS